MEFSIKDFFSKYDQIRSFLRIWSHLLKKSLMENFIFGAMSFTTKFNIIIPILLLKLINPSKYFQRPCNCDGSYIYRFIQGVFPCLIFDTYQFVKKLSFFPLLANNYTLIFMGLTFT